MIAGVRGLLGPGFPGNPGMTGLGRPSASASAAVGCCVPARRSPSRSRLVTESVGHGCVSGGVRRGRTAYARSTSPAYITYRTASPWPQAQRCPGAGARTPAQGQRWGSPPAKRPRHRPSAGATGLGRTQLRRSHHLHSERNASMAHRCGWCSLPLPQRWPMDAAGTATPGHRCRSRATGNRNGGPSLLPALVNCQECRDRGRGRRDRGRGRGRASRGRAGQKGATTP